MIFNLSQQFAGVLFELRGGFLQSDFERRLSLSFPLFGFFVEGGEFLGNRDALILQRGPQRRGFFGFAGGGLACVVLTLTLADLPVEG